MASLNLVALSGNLTRDVEVRYLPSGTPVLNLGLAVNEREKDGSTGEWRDRVNFFNVTYFGGEGIVPYLTKGKPVGVQGRLRWSEWEAKDGTKRSKVEVTADRIALLGGREEGQQSTGDRGKDFAPPSEVKKAEEFAAAASTYTDDDIPFAWSDSYSGDTIAAPYYCRLRH